MSDVVAVNVAQYYQTLEQHNVVPLWKLAESQQTEPKPDEVPHVWHFAELLPLLQQSVDVVTLGEGAERRVLTFKNPGRRFVGATHSLVASLQFLMPGEIAPAHRHSYSALRFMISGSGAYTVVEGEKIPMEVGDLVLTPNWLWHDHGHEGKQEPMVWLDGLDFPFVASLRPIFYQEIDTSQPVTKPENISLTRYGTGTVLAPKHRPISAYSPLNVYKWQPAYEALQRLRGTEQDEYDGTIIEYVNPVTGGHVLATIAAYLQLLAPGLHTKAHRHSSSSVYFVARGSGYSVINGQCHDWQQNDVFVVPTWTWHEHVAGTEEAVLFSYSDLPMLEPFGFWREEAYTENQGWQQTK
jgi:gentisate 1,2-dioxygenase